MMINRSINNFHGVSRHWLVCYQCLLSTDSSSLSFPHIISLPLSHPKFSFTSISLLFSISVFFSFPPFSLLSSPLISAPSRQILIPLYLYFYINQGFHESNHADQKEGGLSITALSPITGEGTETVLTIHDSP